MHTYASPPTTTQVAPHRKNHFVDWEWAVALGLSPSFLLPGLWTWGAFAVLGGLWLWRWRVTGRLWRRSTLDWMLVPVLLGAAIGLFASLDLSLSTNRAWSLVGGVLVYRAIANSLNPTLVRRWGGSALTLLGVLIGVGSLIIVDWEKGDLLKLPQLYGLLPHLLHAKFGSGAAGDQELNPRTIAGVLILFVPVAVATALTVYGTRLRQMAWLAALFITGVLLLTQAPTALLGLPLAAIIVAVVLMVRHRRWVAVGAGVAALVATAGAVVSVLEVAQQLPVYPAEPTLRIVLRLEMWLRARDMFADMPFTGAGLNTFPRAITSFYPTYSLGPEPNAHNVVLQTAVDGGIVGLVGFGGLLCTVVLLLWRGWQANAGQPHTRGLIVAVGIGTLAWLFYGVGESITLAHKPALILWLMWGCVATLTPEPAPRTRQRTAIIGGAGVALVAAVLTMGRANLALNLAVLDGQRAIQNGDLLQQKQVYNRLHVAMADVVASAAVHDLAARLAERSGDYPAAVRELDAEIALDRLDTRAKYIPGEWDIWQKTVLTPAPQNRLYAQWNARFPDDPLSYARSVRLSPSKCRSATVQAFLQQGIARTDSAFLRYLLDPPTGCG